VIASATATANLLPLCRPSVFFPAFRPSTVDVDSGAASARRGNREAVLASTVKASVRRPRKFTARIEARGKLGAGGFPSTRQLHLGSLPGPEFDMATCILTDSVFSRQETSSSSYSISIPPTMPIGGTRSYARAGAHAAGRIHHLAQKHWRTTAATRPLALRQNGWSMPGSP